MSTLSNIRDNIDDFFGLYVLFGIVITVLGISGYVTYKKRNTYFTCVDHGYPSSNWTRHTGGICTRVENGSTVIVKVETLTK